jgi:hypothetical protein
MRAGGLRPSKGSPNKQKAKPFGAWPICNADKYFLVDVLEPSICL